MFTTSIRKFINIITEAASDDALAQMKTVIAGKIKDLPADDDTIKALREIEDLLRHVHAGGKVGMIKTELARIDDPTVLAAQKDLARYILSMDMTPEHRDELFTLWRSDKLVNCTALLGKGKKDFSQIITSYSTNPAIRELVNDVMRISALGQGKGEFGLSVLSKNINKQEGKGDLSINNRAIEVKTTDGGAGRFTDQEVRPGAGFESAARQLDTFVRQYQPNLAKSGGNLGDLVGFYETLATNPDTTKEAAEYLKLVEDVIALIFKGENIAPIMSAFKAGDFNNTIQEYAKTNFNYYMGKKKDEGVLYIGLGKDPIMTVFFKNANELEESGLRLHAGTAYITSIADVRLPYPQIAIVDTTFGANAAAASEKAAVQAAARAAKAIPKPAAPGSSMAADKISTPGSATKVPEPSAGRQKRV